jgi:hypothetical protein
MNVDWFQVMVIVFGNAAWTVPMWLWARAESRSDHRNLENMVNAQLTAIREEMRDFHGRLCAIEERNKK